MLIVPPPTWSELGSLYCLHLGAHLSEDVGEFREHAHQQSLKSIRRKSVRRRTLGVVLMTLASTAIWW